MACHLCHPAVIAAGAVAEDRRQPAHCPGACVPDVMGAVHVTKEHEPWWHLGNTLPEGAATNKFHLVVMVVSCVKDTVRGTVGDEHVERLRDVVPETVDCAAVLHVGPPTVSGSEGRTPETETTDDPFLVDEEVDALTLDQITGEEALLEACVVVPGDKNFCWDGQFREPINESAKL